MNIQTVIPTRGMICAETIRGLNKNNLDGFLTIIGLPIPDAQNEAVRRALKNKPSHILFIEDDTVIPDGALEKMLEMDEDIVTVEYPMDNGYSTITKQGDEILWCGLGCTLIKKEVFDKVSQPYFETNYSWRIHTPFRLERISNPSKYGGQDINFFMKCRKQGIRIAQLEGFEAKHLRVNLERKQSNKGQYEIKELPKITKRQVY